MLNSQVNRKHDYCNENDRTQTVYLQVCKTVLDTFLNMFKREYQLIHTYIYIYIYITDMYIDKQNKKYIDK